MNPMLGVMAVRAVILLLGLTCVVGVRGNPCFFWETSLYHEGYCYKMGVVLSNWTDAQAFCGQSISHGRLAEPVTVSSIEYLAKTVTLTLEDWWIGGVAEDMSSNFIWSSTRLPIKSGNVSSSPIASPGTCVQLTGSKRDILFPVMYSSTCSKRQKFICQMYVGNPCDNSFPGGDYFNDGSCYKLHNSLVHWDAANAICSSQGSKLVEFYSNGTYIYFKNRALELSAKYVYAPANSTVYLEDHNVTLPLVDSLRMLTCGNVKAYLWAESSNASSRSQYPVGGAEEEYYVIEYGIFGLINSSFKYCNATTCSTLATNSGARVNCGTFLRTYTNWAPDGSSVWVTQVGLWVNFNQTNTKVLSVSRMAITTESHSALLVFPDELYSSDIFLGASDIQKEGRFAWLSTNLNVSIKDWLPSEPNDWQPFYGEDHLALRFRNFSAGLNDINGSAYTARPFCQSDILLVTYLIVLPERDATDSKTPEVHVTSDHPELVYLHFLQRSNSGETTLSRDWVTSYRNVIFGIIGGTELRGTDFYHGVVVLKATTHVTVVLHQTSTSLIGSTLVFPVPPATSGYFVLTNASQESGIITVTALEKNTDVTIKFPRHQLEPFTIIIRGFKIQHIGRASVYLDQFDTVHIQSADDFRGTFVYSTKSIAVYSGSKYVQNKNNAADITLDMALQVDALSHRYVTFTTGSSASINRVTYDTFRLLALYDDTHVTISGGSVNNLTLESAGSITDLLIPSGGFHFMSSDPYHPFYVTKVTLTSDGAFTTSLLPDALWRSQYDLYVQFDQEEVAFVVEKNSLSSFLVDGVYNSTYLRPCVDIEGTSLIGCTMNLDKGLHHIGFNDSGVKFVAYVSQVSINGYGYYCHALGSSHWKDVRLSGIASQGLFPSIDYINLKDSEPFPLPKRLEATTSEDTNDSQTTTEQAAEIHTTEQAQPEQQHELTSAAHTSGTAIKTAATTTRNVNETPAIKSTTLTRTTAKTQTSSRVNEQRTTTTGTTTSSLPTDSTWQPNASSCLPLKSPQLNLSREELHSILQGIERLLLINSRETSSFRQRMESTWENRPSCHVIGISGVAIISCVIFLLLANDVAGLLRFILNSINKV